MAVLFVSHASRDDAAIRDLEAWLEAKGFTDRFVDHSNIGAGEKWPEALRKSAGACRVALCFVTEDWLASDICFGEFEAASFMGKRILPLYALGAGATAQPKRLGQVRAEDQGLDVSKWLTSDARFDFSRDPEAARKQAANARRFVELHFSWAQRAARLGEVYSAAIAEQQGRPVLRNAV